MQVVSESEDEAEDEGDLVSRGPRLEAATGAASAYLKPYQLVGINFLLLLYRQKVRARDACLVYVWHGLSVYVRPQGHM